MKKPMTDLDYVEYYAELLKQDNKHFKQHKILIDSQTRSSREFFKKHFGTGEDFKKNARKYLKEMGLI